MFSRCSVPGHDQRRYGNLSMPIIYINRRSEIVRRAVGGTEFYVVVLAAVIHHEAQHLAGASEAEARRAEFAFFQSLLRRVMCNSIWDSARKDRFRMPWLHAIDPQLRKSS